MTQKKKQTVPKKLAHHAKRIFVPHKGNHYRPHLIRWQGLSVVLVIIVAVQLVYNLSVTGTLSVLGQESPVTVSELLQDTNNQRTSNGLPALTLNDKLDQAASLKAQNMFSQNYWAHNSPNGTTPWYWFTKVGYSYDRAGENLAKNYPSTAATVAAWMNSPTHRANVLNKYYQDVGFAVMSGTLGGQPTTLVVAEYGQPLSAATASTPATTYGAPVNTTSTNPLASFGSSLGALDNPAAVATLAILAVVGMVALAAHYYRKKLPAAWRKSWRIHHGVYTFGGVVVAAIIVIIASVSSGGGQI